MVSIQVDLCYYHACRMDFVKSFDLQDLSNLLQHCSLKQEKDVLILNIDLY